MSFWKTHFLIWMNYLEMGNYQNNYGMILASLEWSTLLAEWDSDIVECSKASLFLYIYDSKPVLVTYGYIMMKKKLFKSSIS